MQTFSNDGHKDVDADRDPNLGAHRVVGCAVESLDTQVLFDPFEEQFHPPAKPVEPGHGEGPEREVIGQEGESLAGFGVDVADSPQHIGVSLARKRSAKDDRLVAPKPRGFVDRVRGDPLEIEVAPGAGDKEGPGPREVLKAREIAISTI